MPQHMMQIWHIRASQKNLQCHRIVWIFMDGDIFARADAGSLYRNDLIINPVPGPLNHSVKQHITAQAADKDNRSHDDIFVLEHHAIPFRTPDNGLLGNSKHLNETCGFHDSAEQSCKRYYLFGRIFFMN
jgi:hypothetical protein